jgi:thermitase
MTRSLRAGLCAGLALFAIVPAAADARTGGKRSSQRYVAGQVIVKYAPGASSLQKGLAGTLAGVERTLGRVTGQGARVVQVTGSVRNAVRRLNRSSAVLYAEPNYVVHTLATPDDPLYAQQDDLNNTGQRGGRADADIDAPEGWGLGGLGAFPSTGGAKVGIVDTGVQLDHEDLAGRVADCAGVKSFGLNLLVITLGADPTIVPGRCEDDNGHGTHVAGTIGARADNGKGIAGIAFDSPLSICKALDSTGSGTVVMIANCLHYLSQQGVEVISMSFGSTSKSQTLANAIGDAANAGALLVAAAGNEGDSTMEYPAGFAQVVSVGATDDKDQHASFSTANDKVEISAPGVDTLSTWDNGGYKRLSGTSMATPHVAAVAAIIASRTAGGPGAWRDKLDRSVDDLGPAGRDPQFGFGRVNLADAVSP